MDNMQMENDGIENTVSMGSEEGYQAVATSTESPQPSRSRRRADARRYNFACSNCKSRKTKCSGEQPSCSACRRSGIECTWPNPPANAQLQQANTRIQELERALQERSAPASGNLASTSDGSGLSPTNDVLSPASRAAQASGASLWSQVGVGDDGTVTYNGPTSRFHVGPLEESAVNSLQQRFVRPQTPPALSQARRASHIEALQSQYRLLDSVYPSLVESSPQLKDLGLDGDTCIALLDIYWTWLQPLHNCVYRPNFLIDMAFGGPGYSDFLLLTIFSLSARHLSEQDQKFKEIGKGERFLARAREILIVEMTATKPRIPTIQGLLILGGRQCAMGLSSEGWLYTGMALRMLEDIGLHLHMDDSKLVELEHLTPIELETRKRLYNSAFIWDKTISLALGRSPSLTRKPHPPENILDHCDDLQEWKPSHTPELEDPYVPELSYNTSTFCAHSQLHEITTEMMLLFSNTSSVASYTSDIKTLDAKFTNWYANLSPQLRIEDTASLTQSPPPHIVSLNVLYHAVRILLYRPALSSPGLLDASSAMEICIFHARSIHDMFSIYGKTFLYRLMTYQISYCIFTAATVEAYVMKAASLDVANEAAQRLSAAMRVLRHETRHTPGISRSLDTIRRRLAMWKPNGSSIGRPRDLEERTPLTSVTLASNVSPSVERQNGEGRVDHQAHHPSDDGNGTGTFLQSDHQDQAAGVIRQTFHHPAVPGGGEPNEDNFQGDPGFANLNFGVIDTGAGFHPDAFPWSLSDLMNLENGGDPAWSYMRA
ncbi:hypothetical protein BU24DRAFT_417299 [Aaosphaeria arxii CBS 175.79]|uniref:Zn(2)-C6 fungal-type domain-containing protein n=1 Tax=Aaosphaeria arxii CBS 175.79 TaxID=1450172 RepID=A0A6A5YA32_9PLEO|nr:uncharacterized protein BU24DRAFT_417299 [Aaosphaeria arxii CBS 175.79]KAF2021660.1 hypothetical protein BU24DRAFT_417299 [Aaosphaeria arxii CBS 175.79]